ncbi:extracellular solute-binding protein [Isoptericola sp. b441]|uniref:Extracellular solute-binding protein n=1 Tax=Actinotalea lenta TaxID=3064654 RepID=A0ABT9DC91_9CELL|nr:MULTISPECIES: extracellular solute-binding protein [unclassified Isoptericola]MDO8108524.1 extracellular solute-binding protein [Isoptericola sp. b441]MDO8119934.1 extracellular solute-binding protein [Isoptericola sp. b490]
MRTSKKPWLALTTGLAGIALVVSGCSSGSSTEPEPGASGSSDAGSSDQPITLTLTTFNEFGYEDLIKEYEAAHPNIKIEHTKAATSNEARDKMLTGLAAGSGLTDVEAIEVDWLAELMQYPDKFVDLNSDEVKGRWLDWKAAQATTPDGKLIGYGTDIGPEAVCYRSDLFKAAGLPTDRDEVAALLKGGWDKYFEVGKKFVANSDAAWYDSANAIYQGVVNQMDAAYENPSDGSAKDLASNTEIKDAYNMVLQASVGDNLSAHLNQWTDDWNAAFQNDGFATMLCPGWMLGVIEGNASGVQGWDIANVFPGGGGNWGGSFLTVPTQSKHPEEAKAFAAWLTAPEQQIKAFKAKGTFPSQVDALSSDELLSQTNAFFNNAPTGKILADRAAAVTVAPYKGANYFAIHQTVVDAITRVDVDKSDDAASSWDKAVTAFNELGLS